MFVQSVNGDKIKLACRRTRHFQEPSCKLYRTHYTVNASRTLVEVPPGSGYRFLFLTDRDVADISDRAAGKKTKAIVSGLLKGPEQGEIDFAD